MRPNTFCREQMLQNKSLSSPWRSNPNTRTLVPSTSASNPTIAGWGDLVNRAGYSAHDLAALCQVSLRTLERHFKRNFKVTVTQWINTYRLEEARERLIRGERPKEIAFSLGYKQLSHFSRPVCRRAKILQSSTVHFRFGRVPIELSTRYALRSAVLDDDQFGTFLMFSLISPVHTAH